MTDIFRLRIRASELAALPDEQTEPLRVSFHAIEAMCTRVRRHSHDMAPPPANRGSADADRDE